MPLGSYSVYLLGGASKSRRKARFSFALVESRLFRPVDGSAALCCRLLLAPPRPAHHAWEKKCNRAVFFFLPLLSFFPSSLNSIDSMGLSVGGIFRVLLPKHNVCFWLTPSTFLFIECFVTLVVLACKDLLLY